MIKSFLTFLGLILSQRHLIMIMAKRDLATQYVGSLLGFVWTIINPIILIFVFWVVFSVGFKVKPTSNVPFVVWLTAGMSAWFFFSDLINGTTISIVTNAHLIKKVLFQSQILPVVKVLSCLITHVAFLIILISMILLHKMPFSLYYFQFFYYLFCLIVLGLGFGWALSALNVFIRDVGQGITVLLQIGFWATPVFWDISIMPTKIQYLLKLNPMFYIIQGYRESFIYFCPFWQHPSQTLYFWIVTLIIFVGGATTFRKLKPQFADVL